jgi:glutamate synthase (NADPH) small chain
MGKPTGFLEYTRQLPAERDPLERVKHWHEFHGHLPDEDLREQGARCMDCGVPFCHTGKLINNMASGCPINNLIPEWNDLVYRGQWKEAMLRLQKTNNFPEFTGRVCPAPCEGSCVLGINQPPVTIKEMEVSIVDRAFNEGWIVAEPPAKRTGKKVAVIGSGPAGLACAAQLNKAGHTVTVFERADRIGGLLMYGIPNMKLDKNIVQRRVDLMAEEGVTFKTSVNVGKDFPASDLLNDFDAVVLSGGATAARDLPIEGRNLKGIHLAMEFLHANTKSLLDSQHENGNYISAQGKDVIVIGGGDTGTDCVGTSLRHGCKTLTQFEIMDRPPDERAADNPWPQWPKVYKLDYGQEEAKARFGEDPRTYAILTQKFVGDDDGNLKELHTVNIQWGKDAQGRFGPQPIPGTEKVWPVQLVLLAMGFLGPEKGGMLEQLGVTLNERGNVALDDNRMTNVPGVFAAGDMSRGQSLVVWAIRDGRDTARAVDLHLMGETQLP